MRIVDVSRLKGNEILGKQIFDDEGRVLLNEGIKLTPFYIEKLKELEIQSIYVDDDISKEVVIEENISEKTRQMSKHAVKDMIGKYCREGKADNSGVLKSVNSVIDDVLANKDVLANVSEIRSKDNSIYSHSVNVCVLSTIIATHMGYNMLRLRDVAMAGILHDIGKVEIQNDKKITSKYKSSKKLDEYIKIMHPRAGYDFLGEQDFCNAHTKVAVLMHHEKVDGTGYPLKLKGSEISEIAKLISICDTFDNMISERGTEGERFVYKIIEYITSMSNTFFDSEIVKKFSANIAAFPNGSGVLLNTNEKCLVIKQNKGMPMRPVVKVIYDKKGKRLIEPYEIDLLEELTIFIDGSCQI
ncbi:HD domain-containing protein [Herbivorax sp. ANBcel31]|uniref:HD-GYP domain-containing protein n=1 Tax=Herbivorax sp. ANBcel31 TaxID=3069754 RepID=UPI0027B16AB6|nr:HD domain-containing phosphohydrolase [Herbivorax sp. ANBcel31]MDQ2084907.1 HD domain-containing protein [Herbivorax sp. ANBcel31]